MPKGKPVSAAPASSDGPSSRERRRDRIAGAASDYATRKAMQATGGKPSITGRAAGGAAAGAATGLAIGGPPGAAAGAALGGSAGAIAGRKAKKAYKAAMHASPGMKRIIIVEFLICMVVASLTPLTDRKKDELPSAWMKRMTAIMGVFFILGLISAAGRGSARLAAGIGGLITVTLAISNRDLFVAVGTAFGGAGARVGGRSPNPNTDTGRIGGRAPNPNIEATEDLGPDLPPSGQSYDVAPPRYVGGGR